MRQVEQLHYTSMLSLVNLGDMADNSHTPLTAVAALHGGASRLKSRDVRATPARSTLFRSP